VGQLQQASASHLSPFLHQWTTELSGIT
jgi:hypothetical protein